MGPILQAPLQDCFTFDALTQRSVRVSAAWSRDWRYVRCVGADTAGGEMASEQSR
jgi:hypothetical protein